MSSATPQDDPSVESFFNAGETETLALFEHLSFEFLEEFDVFAPAETGRTRDLEPSEITLSVVLGHFQAYQTISARRATSTVAPNV